MNNKHFNTYKEGLDLEFLREYWVGVCGGENVRAEQNTEESGDSSRQYLIHAEVRNSLKQCIWNIFEKSVQSQILF